MVLIPIKVPQPESEADELVSPVNSLKRRFLGAAVLLALAVIVLPLLLDGSGSESRFRRVENVREYPPKIIGADGQPESESEPAVAAAHKVVVAPAKPLPIPQATVKPAPKPVPVVDTKTPAADKPQEVITKLQEVVVESLVTRNNPSAEIDAALERLGERTVGFDNSAQAADNRVSRVTDGLTVAGTTTAAWVIQAGSFVDQENAFRLRDSLRNRGFPSFISEAGDREVAQTLRFRVQVGPMTDRLNVEQRLREIERITGGSALVREYR